MRVDHDDIHQTKTTDLLQRVCAVDPVTREAAFYELWTSLIEDVQSVANREKRIFGFTVEDADDIAVRAFTSFYFSLSRGQMGYVSNWNVLRSALTAITRREASHCRQKHFAAKRGVDRRVSLENANGDGQQIPCPKTALPCSNLMLDELIDSLGSADQRDITRLRYAGYTIAEIASELQLPQRTVERRLGQVRRQLSAT